MMKTFKRLSSGTRIGIYSLLMSLLFLACTRVMNLSDESALIGFNIKSVTPVEVQTGTPVVRNDTVTIPILRGVALFPLSIAAEPVVSSETETAVPGTSFASFDEIVFDIDDTEPKKFYLAAKSGMLKPCFIRLEIGSQESKSEIREVQLSSAPASSENVVSTRGFVNPVKQTVTLYAVNTALPVATNAKFVLSDKAVLKDVSGKVLDGESIPLSFAKYGDSIRYTVEAENGVTRQWTVVMRQAKEITASASADIHAAVSLDDKTQGAEIKTAGYALKETGTDGDAGELIFVVSQTSRNTDRFEIVPLLKVLPNSQVTGYERGKSVVFENYASTEQFAVLDGRTGYYKRWKFTARRANTGDILKFPVTFASPSNLLQIDTAKTLIDNIAKRITLNLKRTSSTPRYWPLVVTPGAIEHSPDASVVITPQLTFDDINAAVTFELTAANGEKALWTIVLAPPRVAGSAEIENVRLVESSYGGLTENDMIINKTPAAASAADVFIDLKDRRSFPLRLRLDLLLSEGASFESYQNGNFMEFESFRDTTNVVVVSNSGQIKTWTFRLLEKSQLYNCDFEKWTSSGVQTIDPIPGNGRGWATANNVMVKGTLPVTNYNPNNGLAAEMTTDITQMPKNLITAGTLFLGYFDMSSISLDKPRTMTKFGIPFEAAPAAIAVDIKYTPGERYQRSRLVSGSGLLSQYVLDDLQGEDRGHVWAELIAYDGEGPLNYSGEPAAGVHVLARAEMIVSRTGWKRVTVPLNRTADYDKYRPTHLVVVLASSFEGHLFIGAKGSKLTADNFELIY